MKGFIHAIGTALPPFVADQSKIADFMVRQLGLGPEEEKSLRVLYRASGIRRRYSVLEDFGRPPDSNGFFKADTRFPSIKPRMEIYRQYAIELAQKAAVSALRQSKTEEGEITHLIVVSCTGMYAPGLDIELIERLGLTTDVKRTAIHFMGCYASFNGMKVADQIVRADPGANVLMVSVELCTIHFQDKTDDENLLSNCIFGDGAAALVMNGRPKNGSLAIEHFYSDLALTGKEEMGWHIGDYGFEMRLSSKVPEVIKAGIEELTRRLLDRAALSLDDIDFYAIHPGGKRILEVIEEKLGVTKVQNKPARDVLKAYGNMSSPTILFVLSAITDRLDESDYGKHVLSFAFGPGLTLESAVLKIYADA